MTHAFAAQTVLIFFTILKLFYLENKKSKSWQLIKIELEAKT
jgi:hypothetical protein